MLITEIRNLNPGTFDQIKFLLRSVLRPHKQRVDNLFTYCINNSIEWAFTFYGSINLLSYIGWVLNNSSSQVFLSREGFINSQKNDQQLKTSLIQALFDRVSVNSELNNFLGKIKFRYNPYLSSIIFDIKQIPLHYSGLRNFLIDINFFQKINDNYLGIHPEFNEYFEKTIMPLLSVSNIVEELPDQYKQKKVFSKNELMLILSLKEKLGQKAEEFVLSFELNNLAGHKLKQNIKIVSNIDTMAGYDIVSFLSLQSREIDKYIEVKSYSDHRAFYWSRNEVEVAEIKKDHYFLYLVDRLLMMEKNYVPIIIQNPYNEVFRNKKWSKETENWCIKIP